jgi:DNA-binding winged helix-turn-helix (wHTH) protein/tetratricopeptide (TPR) repeat protein
VLHRDGQLVSVPPKALDTLFALVEAEGKVIGKEELLRRVWPETFVEEGSLTQNISILRKALGEDTNGQQYIQTIPKRGYRFVAPVTVRSEPDVHEPEGLPAAASAIRPGRKHALAIAIVLVLAASGAYVAARYPKSKPLTDQDVLVLADFTNSTGDPVFDATLRDALAYQLEQSPFLKVLDDGVMRQDLELMRRSPQEHITNDLAREICVREAKKAILGGSIASLGKSYALDLKAANCQSGAILARERAEAADKEHVLSGLAKAAQGMRAKLGESLNSIEKLAPPFRDWDVTTSSLEAFQAFHQGAQLYVSGHASEAVPVLQRATELDPNLAFAWTFLAGAYYNAGGGSEKYQEYLDRAWALRDRVSAYERMQLGPGANANMEQTIQAAEEFARTYPRNPGPQTTLGRIHQTTGEFEKALANFQEVYRLYRQSYPPVAIEVIGLIMTYGQLDRFDEAKIVVSEMTPKGRDALLLRQQLLWIAYAQGDQENANKQMEWFAGKPDEHLGLAQEAKEARVRGQLRKSRELLRRAADLARLRNLPDTVATYLKPDPAGDALLGDCATARETGEAADPSLDRVNLAALVPVNRIGDAVLALCGTPGLAEKAEERNKQWITGVYRSPAKVPVTRAAIAYGLGDPGKAIELLEAATPYERGYPMANYIRGLADLKLKKGTDAVAEFQKILDHRGANWGPLYPLSYIGVARGAALGGDTAGARKAYEAFFELWKDADSDAPILIQARKEYVSLAR